MAGPDFPRIDRRRLLATGAAVATTAIAPGAGSVEAALANAAQPASLPAEAPPLNVCAATARRLLDIARRNTVAGGGPSVAVHGEGVAPLETV